MKGFGRMREMKINHGLHGLASRDPFVRTSRGGRGVAGARAGR